MSEITLSVGGRNYTVTCADGEEDHVRMLAGKVDSKLETMGTNLAHNDAKNLLFPALMLADDLHETGENAPAAKNSGLAEGLELLADRLENAANMLEVGAGNT